MKTDREVMQQALEALEQFINKELTFGQRYTNEGQQLLASHTAMREALERPAQQEPVALEEYDAGILNDFGGGNVEWWQDYIRGELGRAYEYYQSQIPAQQPQRQPLTDAEIDAITVECFGPNADLEFHRHHARAVIAANRDIKGNA